MTKNQKINDHRDAIDKIDRQLVDLLNRRAEHAIAIGRMKKEIGLPVYDPDRESEIFRNLEDTNKGPLTPEAMQRLFERIIDESRSIERDSAKISDTGSERGIDGKEGG